MISKSLTAFSSKARDHEMTKHTRITVANKIYWKKKGNRPAFVRWCAILVSCLPRVIISSHSCCGCLLYSESREDKLQFIWLWLVMQKSQEIPTVLCLNRDFEWAHFLTSSHKKSNPWRFNSLPVTKLCLNKSSYSLFRSQTKLKASSGNVGCTGNYVNLPIKVERDRIADNILSINSTTIFFRTAASFQIESF